MDRTWCLGLTLLAACSAAPPGEIPFDEDTGAPSRPDRGSPDTGVSDRGSLPDASLDAPPPPPPPPSGENCDTVFDDNNDGQVNEGCVCMPGGTEPCYPGPMGALGRGPCRAGTHRCEGTGEFGRWGACSGAVLPAPENCSDGVDNDCNGRVDDATGCGCGAGMERACYPGPMGTAGVGLCRAGRQRCVDRGGSTDWGPCDGFLGPSPEVCDRLDNDCNGMVDDGLVLGDQCRSARALPAVGGTISGTTCCADVTTNVWHRGTPDVFFVAGGAAAFRATVTVSPGFHVYNVLRDCVHTEPDDCAEDISVAAAPGQRVWVGVVREDPGCGAFTLRVDPPRF